MNRRRTRPDDGFEDLLDGRASNNAALSRLITAARAPGTRDEMVGLPAAQVAFLDATQPRRRAATRLPATTRSAAGRLIALKAMAAVSGATLIGGVAYAATETSLLGGTSDHRKHGPVVSAPAGPRDGSTVGAPNRPAGQQGGSGANHGSGPHGLSSSAHDAQPPQSSVANAPHPPPSRAAPSPSRPTPSPSRPTRPSHPTRPAAPSGSAQPHPSRTDPIRPSVSPAAARSQQPTPTLSRSSR